MKNKIKKIITTTVISAVSLTAIGCGTNNNKLAKNIDKSMENFVSSINNLDYVETSSAKAPSSKNIGKIVETSASENNNMKIRATGNHIQFLNNNISEAEIENTITIPSERTDNFNLFVLSSTPFVTLTSDDNNLNINVKFSTNQIAETSDEIENKINSLILKRSILMIYVNEIYNGNVNLSNENKLAINAYVNVIKENTSFLNGNRGMVKNQLSLASDLATSEQNENLINYYIIKSGEALETRASKLDSTISAIDSIISIIEANLTNSSTYYQSNLSGTYNNLVTNTSNIETVDEITETSSNQEIAGKIACTLDFCNLNNKTQITPELKNSTENTSRINNSDKNNNQSPNSLANEVQNHKGNSSDINSNTQPTKSRAIHDHSSLNQTQGHTNTINPVTENNQLNNNQTTTLNQNNTTQTTQNSDITNDLTINSQRNTNSQNRNNRMRRIPNSVRSRRINGSINNTINSSALDIKEEENKKSTTNQDVSRMTNNNNIRNNNMQNTKTIRAERTPENLTREEYTTTSANSMNEPRASRVPYKSTINNFER